MMDTSSVVSLVNVLHENVKKKYNITASVHDDITIVTILDNVYKIYDDKVVLEEEGRTTELNKNYALEEIKTELLKIWAEHARNSLTRS